MKKYYWLLLLSLSTLTMGSSRCLAQWYYHQKPPTIPLSRIMEFFRNGMNVSVSTDSFGLKWGVQLDRLEEAAQAGLKLAGWELNHSSDLCIDVAVDSVHQQNDSVCTFAIVVAGHRQTIETKRNETALLTPTVTQLVRSIAYRMRLQIIDDNRRRVDPEYMNPRVNEDLSD